MGILQSMLKMAELKREYVVPLRRKTRTAPKWRRSKKAMSVLKEFIEKHMKTDNVVVCKELNEKIWENGIKNPPGKVSVIALKTQILGAEKTFVNLSDIGVDEYVKAATPAEEKPAKEAKEDKKEEVVEAEAKEVKAETKEEKTEEKKPAAKATKKEAKKE